MFKTLALVLLLCVHHVFANFNFLVIGDWGGQGSAPYTTAAQIDSAQGMSNVANSLDAQFVVALGDNFYSSGVNSENDPRFGVTWDDVYDQTSLQLPWYVIAGNHDHSGNVTGQIEYTEKSNRWKFPSLYHSHSFTSGDGATFDLILIDTVDLSGNSDMLSDFTPLPERKKSATLSSSQQWTWIEQQLASSTADYVIVGGHYPVYSLCEHGNTETLVTNLKPLLEKYGAHYLSGHDHCMEHIVQNNVAYILSGMGMECCYDPSNMKGIPSDSIKYYLAQGNNPAKATGGFTSVTVTAGSIAVIYYDQDGTALYSAPAILPREI